MKYAVMTFMFEPWWTDGRMSHERMIEGFAGLGVDGVEPFHTFFVDEADLVGRYTKALGDNGMVCSAVDIICDLVYTDEASKQAGQDDLKRGLDIAAALGAEVAHVAGHQPKDGVSMDDARRMIGEGMASRADFCRQHGLTLAVEDFGFTPRMMCSAESCLEVLEYGGGVVHFLFDTGNFEFCGETALDNFDTLIDKACYVHFKDWYRAPDIGDDAGEQFGDLAGCPLGKGVVPNAQVADKLKARGYDGWVAMEATATAEDPVATVKRDMTVLKGWLA
ncbi:MAG: sugar phosphate isomerase/epimerase family protein [Planctomycetota bacterium]